MLVNIRKSAAGINNHVVSGVLNGLICANPERFGKYFKVFKVTRSWIQSLYQRIKFPRLAVTTLRPVISSSLWDELRSQYLDKITAKVLQHNIPDGPIININQMELKFVAINNITMTVKWEKHILRARATDKRAITVTPCEFLDGCMLPFQVIYTREMETSLPDSIFYDGFPLTFNQKHWSNETKTMRLMKDLLVPYIENFKKLKALPQPEKFL